MSCQGQPSFPIYMSTWLRLGFVSIEAINQESVSREYLPTQGLHRSPLMLSYTYTRRTNLLNKHKQTKLGFVSIEAINRTSSSTIKIVAADLTDRQAF
jgi:hypothetical protein